MSTGRIGRPRTAEQTIASGAKGFADDPAALAAYQRYLDEYVKPGNRSYKGTASALLQERLPEAQLTATGTMQANMLRRSQGGLATALAASNRANPYAAMGAAEQTMTGIDYEGARRLATEKALQQYRDLLLQKKSRDQALLQAQQGLSDQMLGSQTAGLGALLAQYAASRDRAAGRKTA